MVEERIGSAVRLNQPAGHLEDNESLIDAVIRETQEETAWQFHPEALVGVYRWRHEASQETYIRFCFTGSLGDFLDTPLDPDITQAVWLDKQTMLDRASQFRSPLVMECWQDYLTGKRFDLDLLK
ncbi:NUDIX domain-containing protein [Methylophaga sp. OBS3]|uniref:NUDIX domain-containing protein n=1 Tax=Methylophaga sp. OBS3 TaxID=2991934 RepID=UPI00224D9B24|nr:NUDIX hydrolase [Methylophaga sp. OBS3]MCX4189312.1 NUDIX hydrolase [Methylophaga sp. OBS3]